MGNTNRETTHVLLFDDLGVELEVDVLDPLQVDPAEVGGRALLELDQLLGVLQNLDDAGLVLEPVHVLVGVRVAGLEHLDELLVEPLHDSQEAAANLQKENKNPVMI